MPKPQHFELSLIDSIANSWQLTLDQRCRLLSGIDPHTYTHYLKFPNEALLGPDQLTRASYIVGIYRALHTIYPNPVAEDWMLIPNHNSLFSGDCPYTYAEKGGIDALSDIRSLLDGYLTGK